MKELISIILIFSLQFVICNSQWVQQPSGTNAALYDVFFLDPNTGWACGFFESVFFFDSLRGWATGDGLPYKIFKTSDGGTSWDSTLPVVGRGNHIYFLNSQTGWVSIGGTMYKSTDGGVTWFQQFSVMGGEIAEFSFVNNNLGWLVTLEQWRVYRTTNGGQNWTFLDTLPDCFNSHSIFFTNVNTGWVCGDCYQMFKTTDGGFNWFQQNIGPQVFLSQVQFVNDSTGWTCGNLGVILHTTNGGGPVSVSGNENEVPTEFKLYQNYPNPFNQLSIRAKAKIMVYDILGREAAILVDDIQDAGMQEIRFNGEDLSSGLYFYTMFIDGKLIDTKKLILIK